MFPFTLNDVQRSFNTAIATGAMTVTVAITESIAREIIPTTEATTTYQTCVAVGLGISLLVGLNELEEGQIDIPGVLMGLTSGLVLSGQLFNSNIPFLRIYLCSAAVGLATAHSIDLL